MATALSALLAVPAVDLAALPTPVVALPRLQAALGATAPHLLMKRDDLVPFALGGNKVRKMQVVAAEALALGADTLITCGGVQSNHARVTAAVGAALGLKVVLVLNGASPNPPTANFRLDQLFGATVRLVASRGDRAPMMEAVAEDTRAAGGRPYVVPLGASTATGAIGIARAVRELLDRDIRPDVIVHSTSSGGTQAGLIAGCALFGLGTRIVGVSADEPAGALGAVVSRILSDLAVRLGARPETIGADRSVEIDDTEVGAGYGQPTAASQAALELVARREGTLLDPVYTAKAMAGLLARVRAGAFRPDQTVLFWHTGGTPGYFI